MTVNDIKVGQRLVMGEYAPFSAPDYPDQIIWLKGEKDNSFVSEFVLDLMCFDDREPDSDDYFERCNGNSDYALSNILQFLNSGSYPWWTPTHRFDAVPECSTLGSLSMGNRPGFLDCFEPFERDAIIPVEKSCYGSEAASVKSEVRLLSVQDFDYSGDGMSLFRKHGVRAHYSPSIVHRCAASPTRYVSYWVYHEKKSIEGPTSGLSTVLSAAADFQNNVPYASAGLRPVCTLKGETEVIPCIDYDKPGYFRIKSPKSEPLFSDAELRKLLGI